MRIVQVGGCSFFLGRLLFSDIGFCMASCLYNIYMYVYIHICHDGRAMGLVDFAKLSFTLSSLAAM